jgi:hypothetical protein
MGGMEATFWVYYNGYDGGRITATILQIL